MIKGIFFDLDDTILWDKKSVQTAFSATCQHAAGKYEIDPAELEKAVREEAANLYASYETYDFTKMIGINPFEGLWGEFNDEGEQFQTMKQLVPGYRKEAWTRGLKRLGINDEQLGAELAELFPEERKKHPFVYEDSFRVLDRLKSAYKLLLLTNGSPGLQNIKLEITPEIAPYFDHIIISGDFGKGKPDPEIFQHALKKSGLNKEEVLMVGDNLLTDILGASRTGIRSVWINRENKPPIEGIHPTYEIDRLENIFSLLEEANKER